jgi:hypothetical protein
MDNLEIGVIVIAGVFNVLVLGVSYWFVMRTVRQRIESSTVHWLKSEVKAQDYMLSKQKQQINWQLGRIAYLEQTNDNLCALIKDQEAMLLKE